MGTEFGTVDPLRVETRRRMEKEACRVVQVRVHEREASPRLIGHRGQVERPSATAMLLIGQHRRNWL